MKNQKKFAFSFCCSIIFPLGTNTLVLLLHCADETLRVLNLSSCLVVQLKTWALDFVLLDHSKRTMI